MAAQVVWFCWVLQRDMSEQVACWVEELMRLQHAAGSSQGTGPIAACLVPLTGPEVWIGLTKSQCVDVRLACVSTRRQLWTDRCVVRKHTCTEPSAIRATRTTALIAMSAFSTGNRLAASVLSCWRCCAGTRTPGIDGIPGLSDVPCILQCFDAVDAWSH